MVAVVPCSTCGDGLMNGWTQYDRRRISLTDSRVAFCFSCKLFHAQQLFFILHCRLFVSDLAISSVMYCLLSGARKRWPVAER